MCLDTRLTKMSVALAALFGAQAVHSSDSTDVGDVSAVPTINAGKPRRFQFVGKAGQADPGSPVSDSEFGESAGGNGSIDASNSKEKPPSADGAQKVISVEAREEPPTKPNPDQTGHIQYISSPMSNSHFAEIQRDQYLRERDVRHFKPPQAAVSTSSTNRQKKRATAPVQARKPGLPIPQESKKRWLTRIMQEGTKISMTEFEENQGLTNVYNIYDKKHGPRKMIFRGWSPMIVKDYRTLHFTVWNAANPLYFHEVFVVEKLKCKKRPKMFNIVYCNGFVEQVTGYTGRGTLCTGKELDAFFNTYKPEKGHKLEISIPLATRVNKMDGL